METPPDEDRLVRLAQEGDHNAFNALVTYYRPMLLAFVTTYFQTFDSEELVQEITIRLWNELGTYVDQHNFRSWLLMFARRRGIDCRRKIVRYHRMKEEFQTFVNEGAPVSYYCSNFSVYSNDTAKLLAECMTKLPSFQSNALRLMADGHTQRAIAKMTAVTLGTVKNRIEYGIKALRKALEARGIEEKDLHNKAD